MATTDGTAAFEKRKFADNSKLSTPGISLVNITYTNPESYTEKHTYFTYVAPNDGYIASETIVMSSSTDGSVRISNSYGSKISIYVSTSGRKAYSVLPVSKSQTIYAYGINSEMQEAWFIPAQSAV